MKLPVPGAVWGAALVLAVGVSTAEAAKGVKKNGATTIYGEVMNVNQAKGAGVGSFSIKTAQYHKKRGRGGNVGNAGGVANVGNAGNNAGAAGGRKNGQEFHVTASTRFERPNHAPASFASLQQGERVHVRAQGQQALNVQIASNRNGHGRYRGMRHSGGMGHSGGMVQRHNQQHYQVHHASASHARPAAAHHRSKKK